MPRKQRFKPSRKPKPVVAPVELQTAEQSVSASPTEQPPIDPNRVHASTGEHLAEVTERRSAQMRVESAERN